MEAFQLRLWDGRIGRWLSPDPYGEFDSPYLGMGNNPISTIDPDGGCTKCPKGSKDNPIQLQEVVVYSTRVAKPRDIVRDFSFVPGPNLGRTSGWEAAWNRTTGGVQMVGGVLETLVGGIGGVLTSETGLGAVAGYVVAGLGVDNTVTGAKQLWTGKSQNTYLHKGVSATVIYVGADDETAEDIATGADIASLVLGGGSSLNSSKTLRPMVNFKNVKSGKFQIGIRSIKTNKHLRLERHMLKGKLKTHINFGTNGAIHFPKP